MSNQIVFIWIQQFLVLDTPILSEPPVLVIPIGLPATSRPDATMFCRTYGFLFEWLYPAHMPTIISCLNAWYDVPAVTTPLIKFVSEMAFNKSQRITFDAISPNGILLFR